MSHRSTVAVSLSSSQSRTSSSSSTRGDSKVSDQTSPTASKKQPTRSSVRKSRFSTSPNAPSSSSSTTTSKRISNAKSVDNSPAPKKGKPTKTEQSEEFRGNCRSLKDLEDHFPEIEASGGRRLTRSVIRTLSRANAPEQATKSTTAESKSKQQPAASEPSSSSADGGGGGASGVGRDSVELLRIGRKRKRTATASRSVHLQPVKQEEPDDEEDPSASSRRQQQSSSASSSTTGLCQSVTREENRVFPDSTAENRQELPPNNNNSAAVQAQVHHLQQQQQAAAAAAMSSFGSSIRHPHQFLGQLVPRMQNLLGGGGGGHSQSNQRVNQMIEGMRSGNEIRQSEAALELAEMLLMGNEESLPHLPTKEIVAALMQLLQKDHNPELMLTAVRCVTNLLEALPRAMPVVVECVPLLLEKLKSIDYIDVAEAALTALEVMSRRHGQKILSHGGIKSTTSHLDFFSLQSQRVALQIAANCAAFVTAGEFNLVKDTLPDLTQRLQLEDKRCLESVCSVFARLVDNNRNSPDRLREIANHGLLQNLQSLLLVEPPAVGSQCFQSVIRLLRQLCTRCPDLAVTLVENGFARTLRLLIVGKDHLNSTDIELLNRPPQHLQELVLLTGELLPKLPTDGIFDIDQIMLRQSSGFDMAAWYYKDDQDMWLPFAGFDSKMLEMAYQTAQREVTLQASGHVNTVNLERMMQIDEVEGTIRQVQRKTLAQNQNKEDDGQAKVDARREMLRNNTDAAESLIRALFPVLVEIDGSSNGPAIRYESLRTMLRMIEPSEAKLLNEVLRDLPLAQHIASALASTRSKDLCIVASALQIVHLTTDKMPDVYITLFRRQGVAHQIDKLAMLSLAETPQPTPPPTSTSGNSGTSSPGAALFARPNLPPAVSMNRWARAHAAAASSADVTSMVSSPAANHHMPPPLPQAPVLRSHGGSAPVLPSIAGSASGSNAGQQQDILPPPAKKKLGATTTDANAASSSNATAVAQTPPTRKESRSKRTSLIHSLKLPSWASSSSNSSGGNGAAGSSKHADNHHHHHHSHSASAAGPSTRSVLDMGRRGAAPHHLYQPQGGAGGGLASFQQPMLIPRGPHASAAGGVGAGASVTGAYVGLPSGMRPMPAYSLPYHGSVAVLSAMQKEKLRVWIKNEAKLLVDRFNEGMDTSIMDESALHRMTEAAAVILAATVNASSTGGQEQRSAKCGGTEGALQALKDIFASAVDQEDVSAFEVHHSGVVTALVRYLIKDCSIGNSKKLLPRPQRLRHFLSLFCGIQEDSPRLDLEISSEHTVPFSSLISKVVAVVSQQEQFHVRTSDLLGSGLGGGGLMPTSLRGASALRFFQSHQIRCTLRRHPDATELREWRHGHGTIKVDPFTPISAIERYLLDRGVAYPRSPNTTGDTTSSGDDSNEATSDDDEVEESMEMGGNGGRDRRLEMLMGDRVVGSHVTVLQAIRQHQLHQAQQAAQQAAGLVGGLGMAADMDAMALAAGIWINTHTMWYRLAPASSDATTVDGSQQGVRSASSTTGAGGGSASGAGLSSAGSSGGARRKSATTTKDRRAAKVDEKLWSEGQIPKQADPLEAYLSDKLPTVIDDTCAEGLLLLRILYGLSRYWWTLYKDHYPNSYAPIVPLSNFVCPKLAAKVNRQLGDLLSVATQQLPSWVQILASNVPFVLPFVTRRNLYYLTCFGRERALMHLASQGDGGPHHHNETDAGASRLTPRLERKKVSVKRDDLLKQAEDILGRMGGSKAMLEVGFEGEVGTGYGPTLEFYSSVSKEMQKFSLRLWAGNKVEAPAEHSGGHVVEYVHPKWGLYPGAMPATGGGRQRDAKLKKYDFLGKLMGQALMDGRMLDIPMNRAFYKWLLGQEREMSFADMEALDQDLFKSMNQLVSADATAEDMEYMQLAFTMPGQDGFELVKYGNSKTVHKDNVKQYVELVAYWRLVEGVRREMEAVRKGLESVIDTRHLSIFFPEEMDELFCGCTEVGEGAARSSHWETAQLRTAVKPDHGYTHESAPIKWLIDWLALLDTQQRRKFLQFVTGSPRLPVGGFRALSPLLTVVKKAVPVPDNDLPSAMTCYNYLKVPPYSSYQVFVAKFEIALEHVYSFYLT